MTSFTTTGHVISTPKRDAKGRVYFTIVVDGDEFCPDRSKFFVGCSGKLAEMCFSNLWEGASVHVQGSISSNGSNVVIHAKELWILQYALRGKP
jgi:hypothetical protein